MINNSEFIQEFTIKWHEDPEIAVSKTIKSAINADDAIANVDKIQDPAIPINRPKKKQEIKLKKGNKIIQKYIKNI